MVATVVFLFLFPPLLFGTWWWAAREEDKFPDDDVVLVARAVSVAGLIVFALAVVLFVVVNYSRSPG
jgi:hypothetical protein